MFKTPPQKLIKQTGTGCRREAWLRQRRNKIENRLNEEMREVEEISRNELQLRLNKLHYFPSQLMTLHNVEYSLSKQELNKFSVTRHFNDRSYTKLLNSEKSTPGPARRRPSTSYINYLLLTLLLASSTYAKPIAEQSSGPMIYEKNLLSPRIRTEPQVDGTHLRAERSVLSPAEDDISTPSKRDLTSFLANAHRNPQRLVTKMGFYVEIKKNGKVKGNRRATAYSVIEFVSIHTGIVAIKGKKSGRYLAMDKRGKLAGLKTYTPASNFHESLVENNYFVFYQNAQEKSGRKREYAHQVYMAFDKRGRPRRGKKVQRNDSSAHFQKLLAVNSGRKWRQHKSGRRRRSRGRKSRLRKVKEKNISVNKAV